MKLGTHGLPLRSAVVARRRRRLRILTALGALSLLLFLAGVIYEIWPHRAQVIADIFSAFASSSPAPSAPGAAASFPVAAPAPTHPIDSLPVVPGGVSPRLVVSGAMPKVGVAPEASPLAALDAAIPESETVPGAITDASGDHQGLLTHVPFMADARGNGSFGFDGADPAIGGPAALDSPMWVAGGAGGGGGASPDKGASTGANGTSLVAPLGGNERNNNVGAPNDGGPNGGGPNGGGPNGGGPNGGGPNGGGPNGGEANGDGPNGGGPNGGGPNGDGPNGDGPNGGGDEKVPPTGDYPQDTTGELPTTTTGNLIIDTTGDGGRDDDGEVPSVPEPATLTLLALGGCGLAARAARKRRG